MSDKPSPVAYARGCDVLSASLIPLESPPDAAIIGGVGIESRMGKISYLISVMLHYSILRENNVNSFMK